jgi:dUTPase
MVLDSGKEGEICIEFSNYSEDDVNVSYGFVD